VFVIVYEYEVEPPRVAEFERTYAGDGVWAELFSRAGGYRGTELLRSVAGEHRYVVIDRWERPSDFDAFQAMMERD